MRFLKSFQNRLFCLLKNQDGQGLTEYVVVIVWGLLPMMLVRFPLPVEGDGLARNMVEWLIWGMSQYMEGIQFVVAMPIG